MFSNLRAIRVKFKRQKIKERVMNRPGNRNSDSNMTA